MKRNYRFALAILLIAFTIRVAFVNYVGVGPVAGGDGPSLETMGISILHGQTAHSAEGYAFRPPGFPFLIAQVYRFGENPRNIYLAQALLGALSALMLFVLLLRFNITLAVIGSLIFSFHPLMLLFTKQMLTENTHMFLLILITYFAFRTLDNRLWALALGCAWGALILTRSEATVSVLPIVLAVGLFGKRDKVFKLAVSTLIALMLVSPWLYRNYKLLGHATLNTAVGLNFYMSFNPSATGGFFEPAVPEGIPNGEAEQSAFYLSRGLRFIREHPSRAITLMVDKQSYLWQPFHNAFLDLADVLLLPFSLIGVLFALRKREYLLLLAPILGISFVFLIFEAGARYRSAMYPFLISFAALALVRFSERILRAWCSRQRSKRMFAEVQHGTYL